MTTTASGSVWDTLDHTPSSRQRAFLRDPTATLVDLTVLNLFIEYWGEYVDADSFSITLLAAAVLQVLLKLTIAVEHRLAAFFNARQGGLAKFMRFFSAWVVLFGSKFVILEALTRAFGDGLPFRRPLPWDRGPDRGRCRDARGRGGPREDLPPHGLRNAMAEPDPMRRRTLIVPGCAWCWRRSPGRPRTKTQRPCARASDLEGKGGRRLPTQHENRPRPGSATTSSGRCRADEAWDIRPVRARQ